MTARRISDEEAVQVTREVLRLAPTRPAVMTRAFEYAYLGRVIHDERALSAQLAEALRLALAQLDGYSDATSACECAIEVEDQIGLGSCRTALAAYEARNK